MNDKTISITVSGALPEVEEMFRRLARGGVEHRFTAEDVKEFAGINGVDYKSARDALSNARLTPVTTPPSFDQFAAGVVQQFAAGTGLPECISMTGEQPGPTVDAAAVFAPPQIVPELSGSWNPETGHVPLAPQAPTIPAAVQPTIPPAPAAAPDGTIAAVVAACHALPDAPAANVELDGEGLPWDRRIHASTKTRRQSDNTWKLARGVDEALVEQVKGELRVAMSAGAPPAPAAAPQAPPAPAPTTFAELLQAVTAMQAADKIAFTQIVDVCKKHGFANLPLVAARPDMIPTVYADLVAIAGV